MIVYVLVILNLVLCVSILFLIYLFSSDIYYWYKARKIKRTQKQTVFLKPSLKKFKSDLMLSSYEMIKRGTKIEYPTLISDTFTRRLLYGITKQDPVNVLSWNYSESGWLLYALAETEVDISIIKRIFDTQIYEKEIVCVDQSQCGMVALLLYQRTKESQYKDYADKLYNYLNDNMTEMGIPYRSESSYILVDTIGMAIPFIVEYAELFQESAHLAYHTIENFLRYGTDDETGLPVFSFLTTSPHLKCGMSNWGRGCSWLLIGLSYISETNVSQYGLKQIHKIDKTLTTIWERDKRFGHFIGEEGCDLSAELPILYYLYKKNLITLSDSDIVYYSRMCHDGVMYYSSSSNVGIIKYGTCLGPNVLSQAYMLRLINEYETKQCK